MAVRRNDRKSLRKCIIKP